MDWCDWYLQDLARLRDEVRLIDFSILELVKKRLDVCGKIGEIKSRIGYPVYDPTQEEKVICTRTAYAKELGLKEELINQLLNLLMCYSKSHQMIRVSINPRINTNKN